MNTLAQEKNFLSRIPTAQALRSTTSKWDYIKMKRFYKAKDTAKEIKHQPTELERPSPTLYLTES